MHSQETYELIERFLSGECTEKEVAELQAKAGSDPEFAALLQLHQDLEDTIADEKAMAFSKALSDADQAYHANSDDSEGTIPLKKEEKTRTINWRVWGIAASIAILLGIGGIFMFGNKSEDPTALFSTYFDPAFAPSNFRSEADVLDSLYRKAFDAYNAANYSEAIPSFELIYQKDPNQATAGYYLGISQLANKNAEAAIPYFEKYVKQPNSFQQQSRWYLALCFLQKGESNNAKPYLEMLSQSAGKYQEKAKEILKKLK
jgi:tetratricopeptide (TPR) repeat protein